jgi:hypothetical protein
MSFIIFENNVVLCSEKVLGKSRKLKITKNSSNFYTIVLMTIK